ncbi:NADPH-dependent ferric siderophore reductase [Lipingzhangella halophila]|uniref:NADPH-dependent ferric siderophore reductase n=1 Tax=Lipingzhangella halophila TaxID=1783352 RepID=A0A7W7REQ0_9ACTN|nr:siderophore-interacting protein [Lipingzhangella halophila]MBB4930622.1 NADPH-dependent ferric siderophore reductase [Lipingzhangella halophila]
MTSIRSEIRRVSQQGQLLSCRVTVESVTAVSEGYLRVAVTSDELVAYRDVRPADAFKLLLPPQGQGSVDFPERGEDGIPYWPEGTRQPVLRAFTVRRFEPALLRVEFDVARHDGLTLRWLANAAAGDVIGLAGMRREFHAGTGVDHHVIIGDSSALPAVSAIVESLSPDVPASVYLAVDHDSDRALLPDRPHVTTFWVAGGSPVGHDSALERTVRRNWQGRGRTQVWLAAEASVMRSLRRLVLDEHGVSRDDLHSAAYWKTGLDSTQLDDVQLRRYQEELATGADAADPDLRDRVELRT